MRQLFALFALLLALTGGLVAPVAAAPLPAPYAAPALAAHKYTATAATVSNAHPHQNSSVTVGATLKDNSKGLAGAVMTATWHYKTTTSSCTATTSASGVARCSRKISRATLGYPVRVTLTFTKGGKTLAATSTSFTPR